MQCGRQGQLGTFSLIVSVLVSRFLVQYILKPINFLSFESVVLPFV